MVDEATILAAERLRDDLDEIRKAVRDRYKKNTRQVAAEDLRASIAQAAERWLVEIGSDRAVAASIGSEVAGDLNVHFQRLLTFTEHSTLRKRYDAEFGAILKNYRTRVVLPLKTARGSVAVQKNPVATASPLSAFVGQSFAPSDTRVNNCVAAVLDALGIKVTTGEKPKADLISEKVKGLIEGQGIFVGIFTRRDKIARKPEWTTSPWVIDEKAYAVGRQKPLVLLKEQGVGSIGGIQGDSEFITFSRDGLEDLALRLIQLFALRNAGLRK
jgi:hypothetical protein